MKSMVIYITSVEEVPISTPNWVTCGKTVLITSMVKSTTSVMTVEQLKIVSINGVITGTTSMRMVQQLLVPFRLMDNNFTSIKIMVDKLKVLLHQMVTTTMKSLVN